VLRFVVSEQGQPALPEVDLDAAIVVIGSGAHAAIRLPASAARPEHVRIEGMRWSDGTTSGAIGEGQTFTVGSYQVRVVPAPAGVAVSPPQRTESLARELMRSLLGSGNEPALSIERGLDAGARRTLLPPESALVIGRGDDADWVILDADLSRAHAKIFRGWDGTTLSDLDSQNGTKLHGVRITEAVPLHDGARIEIGNLVLVYSDPAERQLSTPAKQITAVPPQVLPSRAPFVIAVAIAVLAVAGLVWILAS
jgi:hypothetical protein